MFRQADCRSRSEFIEQAIRYYVGYLTANDYTSYLPIAMLSNMKSIVAESKNRISRIIFKVAVELGMIQRQIFMLTLITVQRFLRHRQWKTDFQCLRTEALKANGKQSKTRSDFEEVVKKKACKRACLQAFWRRVRDSNPRYISVHDISSLLSSGHLLIFAGVFR